MAMHKGMNRKAKGGGLFRLVAKFPTVVFELCMRTFISSVISKPLHLDHTSLEKHRTNDRTPGIPRASPHFSESSLGFRKWGPIPSFSYTHQESHYFPLVLLFGSQCLKRNFGGKLAVVVDWQMNLRTISVTNIAQSKNQLHQVMESGWTSDCSLERGGRVNSYCFQQKKRDSQVDMCHTNTRDPLPKICSWAGSCFLVRNN